MDARLANYADSFPIQSMGGYFNIMDRESRFVVASQSSLDLIGYKNTDQIHDTTYHDMPCQAANNADLFSCEDATVIKTKKPVKILTCQPLNNSSHYIMLGEKHPLFIDGEVVGVSCLFMDITNLRLVDLGRFLMREDAACRAKKDPFQYSFILDSHYQDYGLSERQAECLFLLLRGKSSKVIAKTLGISFRTVEGYINEIKIKMGCETKSQIIEKSISEGLLNYLPETLIDTLLT